MLRKSNHKLDVVHPGGHKGSPKFVSTPNLIFLCDLKTHATFRNPMITPSERIVPCGGAGGGGGGGGGWWCVNLF